jgi:hypothetical protein
VPRSEYDPDTRSRRERLRSKVQELQRLGYRASERSLYRHVSILRSEARRPVHALEADVAIRWPAFRRMRSPSRRVARDAGTASSRSDRALLILYRAELEDAGIDHRQWSGRRLKAVMQSISSDMPWIAPPSRGEARRAGRKRPTVRSAPRAPASTCNWMSRRRTSCATTRLRLDSARHRHGDRPYDHCVLP